jgi:hypothetical protein
MATTNDTKSPAASPERCPLPSCYVHDREACARGSMRPEDCSIYASRGGASTTHVVGMRHETGNVATIIAMAIKGVRRELRRRRDAIPDGLLDALEQHLSAMDTATSRVRALPELLGSWIAKAAAAPAPNTSEPEWTYPCKGDCGFVRAGVGFQCREAQACGKYVDPNDPGYEDLRSYYAIIHARK